MRSRLHTDQSRRTFPARNNLQWLRLLFAAQVLVVHSHVHLGKVPPYFWEHFPGVPAFFFVSGFLIYASYLNAPGREYFQNRALRLYPALIAVTIGGASVAVLSQGALTALGHWRTYLTWIVAQLTLGQSWNPALFRDVGVGVINGSLWTLTTEMLFYISVPAIAALQRRWRFAIAILAGLSFAVYAVGPTLWSAPVYRDKTFYDFLSLTPIAWGWMFCSGMLAMRHFKEIASYLRYAPLAAGMMAAFIVFGRGALAGTTGNRLGLLYFLLYATCILWLAFRTPYIRLETDLSYGVYIWHMPVINFLLVTSLSKSVLVAATMTVALAASSWILVERPALRRKRVSILAGDKQPDRVGPRV